MFRQHCKRDTASVLTDRRTRKAESDRTKKVCIPGQHYPLPPNNCWAYWCLSVKIFQLSQCQHDSKSCCTAVAFLKKNGLKNDTIHTKPPWTKQARTYQIPPITTTARVTNSVIIPERREADIALSVRSVNGVLLARWWHWYPLGILAIWLADNLIRWEYNWYDWLKIGFKFQEYDWFKMSVMKYNWLIVIHKYNWLVIDYNYLIGQNNSIWLAFKHNSVFWLAQSAKRGQLRMSSWSVHCPRLPTGWWDHLSFIDWLKII